MYLYEPKLETELAKSIWRNILNASDVASNDKEYSTLSGLSYKADRYLPVEFLKEDSERFFNAELYKMFLSSGTSLSKRGRSMFSKDGLELYKASVFKAFKPVYEDFFSTEKRKCISLIPSTDEWKDSSLAQMISWFSEYWELSYVSDEKSLLNELGDEPVWIFATGFHLVNLYDEGARLKLPKGSVVFETGGTKGKSRSVTRAELYQMTCEMFSITQNYIASEYSMSELASQSWDYIKKDKREKVELSLDERSFKFPDWVKVKVLDENGAIQNNGYGALILNDPLRIDYPQPFRIQDMAKVSHDGSFRLCGRMPMAALKGCSLFAEKEIYEIKKSDDKDVSYITDFSLLEKRLEIFNEKIIHFLSSDEFISSLEKEFEDRLLASNVSEDLLFGFKDTDSVVRELSGGLVKKRWLMIPSSTHSQVCFYPVVLSYLLGIELTVRKPSLSCTEAFDLFMNFFMELPYNSINLIDTDFRLDEKAELSSFDAVLLFSSDDTESAVKKFVDKELRAFTSVVCGSLFTDGDDKRALLKDILSLNTKGCMSSKLVHFEKPRELIDELAELSDSVYTHKAEAFSLEAFRCALSFLTCTTENRKIYY